MKRLLSLWFAAALLLALAGCDQDSADGTPAPVDVAPPPVEAPVVADDPAPAGFKEPEPAASADETAVFSFDGLEVPVPAAYLDLLVIETEFEAWSAHWTPLISFSEKASIEAGQLDHPDEDWGDGWLCTLVRLDRIGFEEWASSEGTGTELFAKDGEEIYYLISCPTDVRLYRSGSEYDDASVAAWSSLSDWAYGLGDEIIARNGLAPYDASDLLDVDYTYGGEHFDVGYSFPGEPMDLVILVVSQPERQGEGGIWCVERVREIYSEYDWTNTYLVFPAALGVDETAVEYYARVQAECDAGEHPELLDPIGAAADYARHVAWLFGEDVSESDFEIIESLG